MIEVRMPRLSDSMEEGTLLTWLKEIGDPVETGAELAEIETDKANMVFASEAAGRLGRVYVEAGETVPVGAPIAVLLDVGEELPAEAEAIPALSVEVDELAAEPPAKRPAPTRGPVASPVARRMASEHRIELDGLRGSGPAGRILKADVERAIATAATPVAAADAGAPETAKGKITVGEPSRLQATIARRMSESKATAPHFYLETEVDMTAALAARGRLKEAALADPVPSLNDMIVKASALALRAHPRANGSYRDGRFELHSRVNVGVAVAAPGALVVPTVFDADLAGLAEVAARTRDLAAKVRAGTITPPELAGGTFTVSNLGMFGVRRFAAIVNSPQAAILAAGAAVERPVSRGGEIEVAALMSLTLSCDHRILYGAEAAAFLARVRSLLEEPLLLAL